MAVQTSLPALLDSLTNSLNSAVDATPKVAGLVQPPQDGVSLLDVKNELLLSYLQNLVFLILLKIRNARDGTTSTDNGDDDESSSQLSDDVVRKLVELRLFMDKGVRPLEDKLRFQLDKMLRAADDADRRKEQLARKQESGKDDSDEDDEDEDEAENGGDSLARPGPASAKQFAPGIRGFEKTTSTTAVGMAAAATAEDKSGIYRPPKIAPTVMPTTERREARGDRRQMKSATMDEYIAEELSVAPMAMPSVGTTIVSGGRKIKTAGEKAEEDRRRDYEETNFTRLPKESKKDRAKRSKIEGRSSRTQFGGEDWRELGEGVDRISKLTGRKSGSAGGTRALLEKSRKRGRDTIDSARGSGLNESTREIGDRFNKRVKVMEGGRRDKGKRR
ncbi:U3 small nucleolar ribonucleoprotein LCP5 [Microdochium nivale]|nr:U3 small nucleolar ribonucleoprotein LCP5 [Microdochium nivale]